MDVNQVKLTNYAIGNSGSGAKKSEGNEKEDVKQEAPKAEVAAKALSADEMFDAMSMQGLQNKAQINFAAKKELDPVAFLGKERVNDIEAMMAQFEAGVNNIAGVIEGEFPGAFTMADKNALAANIFAQM